MSTKTSIIYTDDNEHIYTECSSQEKINGILYDEIIMEFDKKNIIVYVEDDENLIIGIKPGSDLYFKLLKKLT